MENIGLVSIDPGLESFKDHFRYRMKRYVDQKKLIERYEGGLEEFALGNFQYHSF
jgi:1,4-alpha-glucan branching enzyme